MNNMWGSEAQYTQIYWPLPIAFYLFLAGLSAGAMLVALFLRVRGINLAQISADYKFSPFFKTAALTAPIAIIIGLMLLIFDLGKPLSFYWILIRYNFTSVMSIGVILLLFYTPLAVIYALLIFVPKILKNRALNAFAPLAKILLNAKFIKFIEILLFILAIGVGAYTGFLLSAIKKLPLWNTQILPLLFLISGFSSGVAISVLGGVFLSKKEPDKKILSNLLKFDLIAIICEMILLCALFMLMINKGGVSAASASSALSGGSLAVIFWVGVVAIGLVLPVLLDLSLKAHKPAVIVFNAIVVIIGVVLLRYYIVYAGQIYTGA